MLTLTELQVVPEDIIVHIADELRHEEVDVLPQQLMGNITRDLVYLGSAVLDNAYVLTVPTDDHDCSD
jgi:hypothetical protein